MKTDYDVIVIGAGPAGAGCAKNLTKKGLKTLIIDKREKPGHTCCNGVLVKETIDFLETHYQGIPEEVYSSKNELKMQVTKRGTAFIDLNLACTSVKREVFNRWLREEAETKILSQTKVIDIKPGEKTVVTCKSQSDTFNLSCSYVVCADGAKSSMRELLHKNNKGPDLAFATHKVFTSPDASKIDDNYYTVVLGKRYSNYKEGFGWYVNKDNLIYIGASWKNPDDKITEDYLENMINLVKKVYNVDLEWVRSEASFGNINFDPDKLWLGTGPILAVGEAAGFISPFGEGVSSALISGKIAAETIISHRGSLIESYKANIEPEIKRVQKRWESGR